VAIRNGLMGEMETIEVDKRASKSWEDAAAYHDIVEASDTSLDY
jgi:hypothetical protein